MNTKDRSTNLIDEELDASFERQMKQIAVLYKSNEPPARLSWTHFQLQIRQKNLVDQKQRRLVLDWARPQPRAPRRLALAMGLLVSLLLLSGFAYVAINLGALGSIFHAEPAAQQLLQANQFTTLHQSQSVDGYKVTLDKAYADANRIILGILVTDPHGIQQPSGNTIFLSHLGTTTLQTQQGQTLSLLGDQQAVDTSNPQAVKEGLAIAFNGAAVQGNPTQLPLNFTLEMECHSPVPPTGCKQTLSYRFVLPFHTGRRVDLHQTVIANGHALTLEQIIVTPSETRLFIHWQKSDLLPQPFELPGGPAGPATWTETIYDLQLSANGQTYLIGEIGTSAFCRTGFGAGASLSTSQFITDAGGESYGPLMLDGNPQTIGCSLFQPLYQQHGTWTLTITQLSMPMNKNGSTASPSKTNAAPWIFTFNMP